MGDDIELLYWKLKQYEYEMGKKDSNKFGSGDLVYVKDYVWLKEHGFSADMCFEVLYGMKIYDYDEDNIIGYVAVIAEESKCWRGGDQFTLVEGLLEYYDKNKRG